MLDFYKELKGIGYPLYLFTSDEIQDDLELHSVLVTVFDKIFSAKQMGLTKADPYAFEVIAKNVNADVKDILFIDDAQKYLTAANDAGCQTIQFISNDQVLRQLHGLK